MKKSLLFRLNSLLIVLILVASSCVEQQQTLLENNSDKTAIGPDYSEKKLESIIDINNSVYCVLLDSKGIIWIGTTSDGVYSYDGTKFVHYTVSDGLNNNKILTMIEDQDGILWLGTSDGLCKFDRETFKHVPIPFSDTTGPYLDKVIHVLNPNAVHALHESKNGDLWIGTAGAGAYRYDGEKFDSFLVYHGRKQIDSLHHNWITSISEDNHSNIWFSSMTRGGASKYDGKQFTHYMPEDGLFTDMVRTIFTDRSGIVWFGYKATNDGGFSRYDGKSFFNFDSSDGLCNNSIRVIYQVKNGDLWLGGDLNNLCIYDGENFEEFTSSDGDTFEGIFTIIEDSVGNVWFGGRYGLWKYDGETVTDMVK